MRSKTAKRATPSLRRGLLILMAALGIPLVSLEAWWGFRDYEVARVRAGNNALGLADAISLGVLRFLGQTEDQLLGYAGTLARDLTTRSLDFNEVASDAAAAWCRHPMDRAVEIYPSLVNAMLLGPTGRLVCSFRELPGPIDRKSTRLNSSHSQQSRMPSSA